jgi:hypothetical protein
MKTHKILALTLLLTLTACQYLVPLSAEHNINVDTELLGHWSMLPDKSDPAASLDSMTVLQFSDTEYLINYISEGSAMAFRAYLIEAGNQTLLQLEYLGTDEGPPREGGKDHRFIVVKFVLQQGQLEVKTLNTELVSRDLRDSEAMMKAYLANLDNPDLFSGTGFFTKQ